MKKLLLIILIPVICFAQKYKALNCEVSFFSSAPLEDIKAVSHQLQGIIDVSSGDFFFRVPIKSFTFKRSLMQTHFNNKYMESDIYSSSILKGKSLDLQKIISKKNDDFSEKKSIPITGELSIHGITRNVLVEVFISKKNDEIIFESEFFVKTEDYKIKIPKLLKDNISKQIHVKVLGNLILF